MNIAELKCANLRDSESMAEQLAAVNNEPHLRERFYPILTAQAGRRLNGMGVIVTIQLAISDYVRGMPAMMAVLMDMQTLEFARAIMPDDEVYADAEKFYAEVLAS